MFSILMCFLQSSSQRHRIAQNLANSRRSFKSQSLSAKLVYEAWSKQQADKKCGQMVNWWPVITHYLILSLTQSLSSRHCIEFPWLCTSQWRVKTKTRQCIELRRWKWLGKYQTEEDENRTRQSIEVRNDQAEYRIEEIEKEYDQAELRRWKMTRQVSNQGGWKKTLGSVSNWGEWKKWPGSASHRVGSRRMKNGEKYSVNRMAPYNLPYNVQINEK